MAEVNCFADSVGMPEACAGVNCLRRTCTPPKPEPAMWSELDEWQPSWAVAGRGLSYEEYRRPEYFVPKHKRRDYDRKGDR